MTEELYYDDNGHGFSIIVMLHEHSNPVSPFLHALALAVVLKAELEIVDVRNDRDREPLPGVRQTLEQWGKLPAGSQREDVVKIGIRVKKIHKEGNPKQEIEKRLTRNEHTLLVIGTEEKNGIAHLFGLDLIDYLIKEFRQTTLYIPHGARPFVDFSEGSVTIDRILVAVAETPSPEPSLCIVRKLIDLIPSRHRTITGVHFGESFPSIPGELYQNFPWNRETRHCNEKTVSCCINETVREYESDLVVMSTNGRETLGQKILGCNTEQLLRLSPCPVLAVATME